MAKEWGPCTWYLFHTLAEKMKVESFPIVKNDVITMIRRICSNLPCPECAGHAQHKMGTLNVNHIRSKRDLQLMLLSFHNDVNNRNGKPQFTEQQLDEKYRTAKTSQIVQYFVQVWNKPNTNPKMLTASFHKGNIMKDFMNWWKANYIHFDP